MKKHYIDIVGKWAFIFAYDIEERDLGEVGDWLEALGASKSDIHRSQYVLSGLNTGLTFSSDNLRMSVMCIGDATDEEQWWDTLDHEIDHLQYTILSYYDVEPGTEEAAYLQGYIMRGIVKALRSDGIMLQ